MKFPLFTCCILPLVMPMSALAGINGVYKVQGTEVEEGESYRFSGNVTISQFKSGTYALKFNDGDRATYKFNFARPLKESTSPQTVGFSSSLGTGSATFSQSNGKYKIRFTYKARNADVRGSGTGTK